MSRISPGTIIVGIFALLFGLVGAYVVRQSLQRPVAPVAQPPAARPPQPTIVPLAGMDLPADRPITLGDIAIARMTQEQLKERKLGGFMTNTQQIIGRTLRDPLKKGETFKPDMFYAEGTGPNLAEKLEPGLRAVTVPIAQDLVGFVSPGTMVDIIFRTHPEVGTDIPETTVTLLENVRVLALGRSIVPGATTPPTSRRSAATTTSVTLAVGPEQASALKIVEDRGDLMLTLRNPDDGSFVEDVEPQTLDSLLGWAGQPQPLTTDVFRGNTKETVAFEAPRRVPAETRISSLPVRKRTPSRPSASPTSDPDADSGPLPDADATSNPQATPPSLDSPKSLPSTNQPNQAEASNAEANPAPPSESQTRMVVPTGRFETERFDRARPSIVVFQDGERVPAPEPAPDIPSKDATPVEVAPELPRSMMSRVPTVASSPVLAARPGNSRLRRTSKVIEIPSLSEPPAGR